MSQLHVPFFGVISNKETLGKYKDLIESGPQKFYNKCLIYLLEAVCNYLRRFNARPEDLSVVLEARNHDYDKLIRYLITVRDNPIYPESRSLVVMNPFSISTRKKGEDDCLEYADFVAHSLFQCVNKAPCNYFIPESIYYQELSRRFGCDSSGLIVGHGLKFIQKIEDMKLDDEIRKMFETTRATPS